MKSKNMIRTVAAAVIITVFAAFAYAAEEKEESISMDQVPQVVKTTLAKYASESEVKKVEKGDQDGKKVFEFDIEKDGRKFEVAISPKGKFMGTEEDVEFKDLPEVVQKSLTAQANGAKISGCEKAVDAKKKVSYEAEIEKDGKKTEVAVDADGKPLSSDTEPNEKSEGKSKEKD